MSKDNIPHISKQSDIFMNQGLGLYFYESEIVEEVFNIKTRFEVVPNFKPAIISQVLETLARKLTSQEIFI